MKMQNRINIYNSKLLLILVSIGVLSLVLLGNWQLKRLAEKNVFIKTIEHNIASPAISISSNAAPTPTYSKVAIVGRFLPNKNILLYGRRSAHPEKDGYYMLSAFEAENGQRYLVSRGWIPQSLKDNFYNFILPHDNETIEAFTLPSEHRSFMMPKNDNDNNIWFTIDLQMAHNLLGVTETKYYLMQINNQLLPNGAKSLSANQLSKVRNDHLEYAMTWYSLAICLALVFIISCRKQNK